ncbi:MAG TPA: folylpolyglutamate synthase/dihydrofolate synthase family protein [Thermoanaerobaculia bacterium]|nr:folylpolyglutamate synthase/dihydrofolate synthase family protein [Thermoanaerobaculia bacterium]
MIEQLAWLDSLQGSGIRPGLGRMRAVLRVLGRPQHAYRSVIVAGTNGKGSTSATLASILHESGYRTGLYTSPHLVDIRERWMIGGKLIDPALLDRAIDELRRASEDVGIVPTYFEAMTLIAFIAFRDAGCEVVVLEVGMGGRLDATNVVRPIAAIITPIGLDHTEYLGNTIRKIAAEKAGVIHRGAVVLTSNCDPAILGVLQRRAEKFDDRFIVVCEEHSTPLAGDFQRHNVALAVRAANALRAELPHITNDSIERGVARTRWRGRLERIDCDGKTIWIDGLHNAHAAAAVAPFIDANVARPRLLVFGIMRDKNVDAVAEILFPKFDSIIATDPYPPRSAKPQELVAMTNADAIAEPQPSRAFDRAMRSGYDNIFIGGSLYLAGAAIEYFDAKRQETRKQQK